MLAAAYDVLPINLEVNGIDLFFNPIIDLVDVTGRGTVFTDSPSLVPVSIALSTDFPSTRIFTIL